MSTNVGNIARLTSIESKMPNKSNLTVSLDEFNAAWNSQIICRTSCEFYQYRLQFIDDIKSRFVPRFQQLISTSFTLDGKNYILRRSNSLKLLTETHNFLVSIEVALDSKVHNLWQSKTREMFDGLRKIKEGRISICILENQKAKGTEISVISNFRDSLEQLFLSFVVDWQRIDPLMLKENQEAQHILHSVSYQQLERIKSSHSVRYQLNLIDKSTSTLDALLGLIESPNFSRQFQMFKVFSKNRVKYVYKEPITEPVGDDRIALHERNFSLDGFRKHISYMIPFWFTLELVFQSQNYQSYCEVVLVPPLFDSELDKKKLTDRVKNYIINLSQATNTKVLLILMEKTRMCPILPYELFVSQKLNSQLWDKPQSTKPKSSFASLKNIDSIEKTIFKVPFLNVSAYPLYERFADGNGIDNIKKSDLWREHAVQNLEDTYVIKFKNQVFIVTFKEILPYKQKKNLSQSLKNRKLLVYEVYGLQLGVSKEDFDFEFRGRIRQAQLQPLLGKISEHLIKAPQVLSQFESNIFQRAKKLTFKVKLPYMSCYGVYLCYLRQRLNYVHRKTSRKRHHHNNTRKFSAAQTTGDSFRDQHKFTSFIQDSNNFEAYEYFYNEEDQMLFLFNFAAPRGNRNQPFGNCIYLLTISMMNMGIRIDEMTEYIDRQPIATNCKKKSFYVHGVDPTETKSNKFKEVKELIENLNQIFPQQCDGSSMNKRDSDVLSSSSSINSDVVVSENYIKGEASRPYQSMEIEFSYQIIGNESFQKIQEYCQTQIQGTFCDYLIESMIFQLKKTADDYINLDIQLMSKKKRRLSFDDIQPIIQENLSNLLHLSSMSSMKKSLTVFNYKTEQMDIHEPKHIYKLLIELANNITQVLNGFVGATNKRPEMIYYVMNSHKRLINYGCLSKLVITGSPDHTLFNRKLNKDPEVGLFFGSHLAHFLDLIEDDKKKTDWIQSIKQYPDGKFFGNEAFNFKRNFLMHVSIDSMGIRYFTYNVNRNVNYLMVKNLQSISMWNIQKKLLLQTLKTIKEGGSVCVPSREHFQSKLHIEQVWDPYTELAVFKESQKKRKPKIVTLTDLFKDLVFQLVPPTTGFECVDVSTLQVNRIYLLLMNQKINIPKFQEQFGQIPKSFPYKCELSRLGFQVLSILRYNFSREIKKKQEQEDT